MNLSEHIKEHINLGLDFRIPADGNTYFKFSTDAVELYVNGVLKQRWKS